jgi:Big-like domain-containing protein
MQKLTRSLAMAGALAFAGVLAGCGDDVTVSNPTVVTVTPASASIQVGGSVTLTASVTGDIANKTVTWSSSDASKATVDANGKVTGVAVGSATIIATSAGDANAKASALITVTAANKGVQKVEISPNNAIIKAGDFLQLTANVTRDPGVAGTVTWSSSATGVATVDATGKVTGVANGSAIITAASTVDPTVTGTSALTVRPLTPAQISIQKITVAGNTNNPVDFNNVKGQIDVTLNLNPGDQTVTKVEVFVDNATTAACSQSLSVAQSQQLSLAAVFEDVQPIDILCSINTAAFNLTTGAVTFVNGSHTLTAKATIGGATPGNVASPSQALTFNNTSGFIAAVTNTATNAGAPASANNPTNGKKWVGGNVTLTLTGVSYVAGGTFTNINVSFLGKTTNSTPATGTQVFTISYPNSGTGALNIVGYENSVASEQVPVINSSTLSNGNSGGTNIVNLPGSSNAALPAIDSTRVDNKAPGAPSFFANPNFRQNGWVNANVQMTTANAASAPNGWFSDGTADAGVGGYVRFIRIAAATGGLVDDARAATATATPTLPAPSPTATGNATNCAIITAKDLLGNETARPAAGVTCALPPAGSGVFASTHMTFGVDIAPPTIDFSGGLAANSRNATADLATAGQFQVTVGDTGSVGVSGMLSGGSVVGTVTLRGINVTGAATCIVGTFSATTGICSPASVNATPAFPLVPTTYTGGQTGTNGYYTYTAVSVDAAGNSSASVSRVALLDDSPPVVSTASFPLPFNVATPNLQAQTSDDLDVQKYQWFFSYGAAMAGLPIETPSVAVNGYNAATFINSNVPLTFNSALLGQIHELGTAWTAPAAAAVLANVNSAVTDQGNNATSTSSPVIVNAVANPFTNANGTGWAVTSSAGNTLSDGNVTAPTTPANPLSTTLRADATGASGTFSPNLSRVDFYALNAAGTRWVLIGSDNTADVTDNGSVRQLRYTLSFTPGTAFAAGTQIRAVGVSGTAGYSTASLAITITNP